MPQLYQVVRYYQDPNKRAVVQKENLTLEQAREWCSDDETSSKTASKYASMTKRSNLDKNQQNWFDGYRSQG